MATLSYKELLHIQNLLFWKIDIKTTKILKLK